MAFYSKYCSILHFLYTHFFNRYLLPSKGLKKVLQGDKMGWTKRPGLQSVIVRNGPTWLITIYSPARKPRRGWAVFYGLTGWPRGLCSCWAKRPQLLHMGATTIISLLPQAYSHCHQWLYAFIIFLCSFFHFNF